MTKRARVLTADAEIDAAIALANLRERYRPKAVAAEYRTKEGVVAIKLASGVELVIPRKLLQGLENATPEQAAGVEILGPGTSLHWKALNVDHYVPSLIEGIFGNRRWMSELGKRGGAVRSEAKTQAARKNGQKGGRPRKRTAA
ncbi:MAG: DUF2442 domain-containing protein [Candidatus Tumulicola sp.]